MKNPMIKSIFLIPLLLFVFSFPLLAQSPDAAKAARATRTMTKELNLSKEQISNVNAIYLKYYRGLEDLKTKRYNVAEEEKKVIAYDFETSLGTILTKEQLTAWKEYSVSGKSRIRIEDKSTLTTEDRVKIAAKRKAERMAIKYTLTLEQEEQVFNAYFDKMMKVVALRPLSKKDAKAAKEARRALDKETQKTIDEILTEEQRNAIAATKEARRKARRNPSNNNPNKKKRTYLIKDQNTENASSEADIVSAKLNLSDELKKKYQAAALNRFQAIDRLRNNKKSATEKAAIRVNIDKKFNEEIATFLTEEQLKKLEEKSVD